MSHDATHTSDSTKIGLVTIWAIGVGSALGGDFFGWQFVLYGGFGSAFTACIFTAVFYWLYAHAITELAARYKISGGAFSFVKCALGLRAAALMAVLGLLKLMIANSATALAISSYLVQGGMPRQFCLPCWIVTYGFFTLLDCIGVRQSADFQVLATAICVAILIFYCVSSFTGFKLSVILKGGLIHDGALGYFKGLPFALQFFDGFEEVPLLMSYALNAEVTIPRAMILCYSTVSSICLMMLFAGSGITPAAEIINSDAPLMDGIELIWGDHTLVSDSVAYLVVLGLIVNFFAFILFTSQQVQAVAEAGQLPKFLSYRHPVHGAPIAASIASSVLGVVLTAGFTYFFDDDQAQDILVTAALLPAVLSYALLLECVTRIRKIENAVNREGMPLCDYDASKLGDDPGPLRFAYGTLGARVAQVMCVLFIVGLLTLAAVSTDFLYGVLIVGVFGVIALIIMNYYIGVKRRRDVYYNNSWRDEDQHQHTFSESFLSGLIKIFDIDPRSWVPEFISQRPRDDDDGEDHDHEDPTSSAVPSATSTSIASNYKYAAL